MFTGIVEEVGEIVSVRKSGLSAVLRIKGYKVLEDVSIGDSIAVNGICLTVTDYGRDYFEADVMVETVKRTSLVNVTRGMKVNLERALAADGRFGGHIVSGHIDGTGKIISRRNDENAVWFTISADEKIMRYIVEKGSITIDGISLTVADVNKKFFSVSIIPHTLANTVLGYKSEGDIVNLENDIIGKYVEKFVTNRNHKDSEKTSGINMEFLLKNGF